MKQTAYEVPESHPRFLSLMAREKIVAGVENGVTSIHGLIAHGRGEAFDYLIGEATNSYAIKAMQAAICLLLDAKNPVVSINGNVAALAAESMVELAELFSAKIEVNIFHASAERELKIKQALQSVGATEVLMPQSSCELEGMEHNRRYVNPEGIKIADVILVPLEDGDRCQALIKQGKKVIVVDLNPRSRTAQMASVSIVDNVMRVTERFKSLFPQMEALGQNKRKELLKTYDNQLILKEACEHITGSFLPDSQKKKAD